jgi:hypothetical protein
MTAGQKIILLLAEISEEAGASDTIPVGVFDDSKKVADAMEFFRSRYPKKKVVFKEAWMMLNAVVFVSP